MNQGAETGAVVAAAQAGDETAFASLVERYRRELHVHCYRMVGSFEDAEDLVQETFLRAWRKRASFEGRSTFRAWLYRIATNACLDALAHDLPRPRNDPGAELPPPADLPWLQPYPDLLLDGVAPSEVEPDAAAVSRETIELAFLAAIQHLPPRQRAVLILRDVLGWSAKETASLLEGTVASVNSALQRARATLKERLPRRRLEWAADSAASEEERALLQRYVDAHDRADIAGLAALLRDDALLTMPPQPLWYRGRDAIATLLAQSIEPASPDYIGHFRLVPTRANRQPAAANYLRRPGDSVYRALALDVLRVEEGQIVEIVAFPADLFPAFGLSPTL